MGWGGVGGGGDGIKSFPAQGSLGICWWVISKCIVHHLSVLGFMALSFLCNNNRTVLIPNYCFYPFSPLGGERGSECIVLSCQLALNHNIQAEKPESSVLVETISVHEKLQNIPVTV